MVQSPVLVDPLADSLAADKPPSSPPPLRPSSAHSMANFEPLMPRPLGNIPPVGLVAAGEPLPLPVPPQTSPVHLPPIIEPAVAQNSAIGKPSPSLVPLQPSPTQSLPILELTVVPISEDAPLATAAGGPLPFLPPRPSPPHSPTNTKSPTAQTLESVPLTAAGEPLPFSVPLQSPLTQFSTIFAPAMIQASEGAPLIEPPATGESSLSPHPHRPSLIHSPEMRTRGLENAPPAGSTTVGMATAPTGQFSAPGTSSGHAELTLKEAQRVICEFHDAYYMGNSPEMEQDLSKLPAEAWARAAGPHPKDHIRVIRQDTQCFSRLLKYRAIEGKMSPAQVWTATGLSRQSTRKPILWNLWQWKEGPRIKAENDGISAGVLFNNEDRVILTFKRGYFGPIPPEFSRVQGLNHPKGTRRDACEADS